MFVSVAGAYAMPCSLAHFFHFLHSPLYLLIFFFLVTAADTPVGISLIVVMCRCFYWFELLK